MARDRDNNIKYPLVYVEWIDAQSDVCWGEIKDIDKWADEDCLILELGWMIKETDKYIVITNQIGKDEGIGNRTKIPAVWIKHIEKVSLRHEGLITRTKRNSNNPKGCRRKDEKAKGRKPKNRKPKP